MTECSQCGTANNDLALHCRKCGSQLPGANREAYRPPGFQLPVERAEAMQSCSHCGKLNQSSAAFCRKCGKRLAGEPPAEVQDNEVSRPEPPAVIEPVIQVVEHEQREKGNTVRIGAVRKRTGEERTTPVGELRCVAGPPIGISFGLFDGRTFLGSSESECHVVIPKETDPRVSDMHCLLRFRRGQAHLADMESANGTWVDMETLNTVAPGEQLPPEDDGLAWRDMVVDGSSVRFVNIEDEPAELHSGSLFRMGDTVLKLHLNPQVQEEEQ